MYNILHTSVVNGTKQSQRWMYEYEYEFITVDDVGGTYKILSLNNYYLLI